MQWPKKLVLISINIKLDIKLKLIIGGTNLVPLKFWDNLFIVRIEETQNKTVPLQLKCFQQLHLLLKLRLIF